MTSFETTQRPPRPTQDTKREQPNEPAGEDDTESTALVSTNNGNTARLAEVARQRLLARGDEAALLATLQEAPEKKLDAIEKLMMELSTASAQITPDQYRSDPEAFATAVTAVDQRIKQIETLLVTFVTAAKTEYIKIPVWQKFLLAIAALLHSTGREANLLLTLSRAESKREELLGVAPELRELLEQHRAQIEHVKQELKDEVDRKIRIRQQELLANNIDYQQLKNQRDKLGHDLTTVKGTQDYNDKIFLNIYSTRIGKAGTEQIYSYNFLDRKKQVLDVITNHITHINADLTELEKTLLIRLRKKSAARKRRGRKRKTCNCANRYKTGHTVCFVLHIIRELPKYPWYQKKVQKEPAKKNNPGRDHNRSGNIL